MLLIVLPINNDQNLCVFCHPFHSFLDADLEVYEDLLPKTFSPER